MQESDSLDDLPLYQHHFTHGMRESLDDYTDLGELVGDDDE